MIDNKTVNQVIQATVNERIRFIELILQSLKKEIKEKKVHRERRPKRYKVRQFGSRKSFGNRCFVLFVEEAL